MASLDVTPISCLSDNYAYLLVCRETGAVGVVDPSEPKPVIEALEARGLEPAAILNTHHHGDHVGGNEGLLKRWPGLAVYGHQRDRSKIPGLTGGVDHDDVVELGGCRARVLHNPGHTMGAITYAFDGDAFTGDTLFQGGCGRVFEGDPETMYRSLTEVIGSLPDETRIWCGHEYTVKNLRFAAAAEPDNRAVADRLEWARRRREADEPTVPSTLGEEWTFNPFMRAGSADRFAELRAWKNRF